MTSEREYRLRHALYWGKGNYEQLQSESVGTEILNKEIPLEKSF